MTLLLIGIAAGTATFIGGALALRFRDKLHLILGFSAGAVIGVALFDLLPEAIEGAAPYFDYSIITAVLTIGFFAYMLIDRALLLTAPEESDHRGHVGAGSLTVHSFLDGLGIGLAFQVSPELGAVVAVAVLVHDFSDGVNTVNVSLSRTGKSGVARGWLIADALAPLAGIFAASFVRVSDDVFSLLLALFAGFFLYIGASELLPDSHHRHPRYSTAIITVVGASLIWLAIHFSPF